jgi:hypothetical protein
MLRTLEIGGGNVARGSDGWRLEIPAIRAGYADAQLDDTQGRRRSELLHRPPIRLSLEARAEPPRPSGTFGFGLWNDPFPAVGATAGGSRFLPASPQALWFFWRSAPSDLSFARGEAGVGWCAASLKSPPAAGGLVALLGAAAYVGMLARPLRGPILRRFWRTVHGHQRSLPSPPATWRRYEIEWERDLATFLVDGESVLRVDDPPSEPLGIVLWIDNQWAVFTQSGGMRFGVVPTRAEARLEVRNLVLNGGPLEVAERAARGE